MGIQSSRCPGSGHQKQMSGERSYLSPQLCCSPSAALQLGIRILAVAKVVKTFGDSRDRPKLLTSFATLKLSCNAALVVCPGCLY